ncbi:hypothetical protein Vadar_012366 [Vaccinium darrowii]|uniref:Uncharacterized protein n=1 Tax=Vaccinium darrowii TaxID=229202 RepID=A0ACB7ZB34_9ERIC|nr:hypothetical protein Vadar_012366 [Vaccinium darrowii]
MPSDITVEISGSASQIQTAQQLILVSDSLCIFGAYDFALLLLDFNVDLNFIAEAASVNQNIAAAPTGQQHNYPSHGPVYASPPSNPGGHAGYAPTGDYGSA